MISVCMITYNGEKFVEEQIRSILVQLDTDDELIISDDGSIDKTCEIIRKIDDNRIRLFNNRTIICKYKGTLMKCYKIGKNMENALNNARGELIFLADQDDIWTSDKVARMKNSLNNGYDFVLSNCIIMNESLETTYDYYFSKVKFPSSKFFSILKKTSFLGCCIAFRKELLHKILPFKNVPLLHDAWISLVAIQYSKIKFEQIPLLKYRKHNNNNSSSFVKSGHSLIFKIIYRLYRYKAYLQMILFSNKTITK